MHSVVRFGKCWLLIFFRKRPFSRDALAIISVNRFPACEAQKIWKVFIKKRIALSPLVPSKKVEYIWVSAFDRLLIQVSCMRQFRNISEMFRF